MRWIIIFIFCLTPLALGETPATLPATTQPSQEFDSSAPARKWFSQLASPDDEIRDEAQTHLMGLSRDDLPRLKKMVQTNRPLDVAQAVALHRIVVQVYLSGEIYPAENGVGFLGLQHLNIDSNRLGAVVESPLPGFPSFQTLRPGDLILGVLLNPDVPLQDFPNQPTPDGEKLKNIIAGAGANRTVVLEILRQGQHRRVPLRLAPRPMVCDMTADDMNEFITSRQKKGEDYWQREFAPLIRAGTS